MRVLHIVESYGAGTQAALHSYVASTPEYEHHLLRGTRGGEEISSEAHSDFASVAHLASGFAAIGSVNAAIERVDPDVVHMHSSIAGVYGRLARRSRALRAYTPHCFAFERQDLSGPKRAAIKAIERVLTYRTDVIVACSRHEAELARGLRRRGRVTFVPNVALLPEATAEAAPAGPAYAVALGRISPQKRPASFAAIARGAGEDSSIGFTWIGEGDDRPVLEKAGVEVAGWQDSAGVVSIVSNAAVFVHTGAWEGFPMAVLEANQLRTPIVALACDALSDAPSEWLASDPAEALELIRRVVADESATARNLAAWDEYLAFNTRENQRATLMQAYAGEARR